MYFHSLSSGQREAGEVSSLSASPDNSSRQIRIMVVIFKPCTPVVHQAFGLQRHNKAITSLQLTGLAVSKHPYHKGARTKLQTDKAPSSCQQTGDTIRTLIYYTCFACSLAVSGMWFLYHQPRDIKRYMNTLNEVPLHID